MFPYAAIYRLQESGYIAELPRRIAPDGRRRQYFTITPEGVTYLARLRDIYAAFSKGVAHILDERYESNE